MRETLGVLEALIAPALLLSVCGSYVVSTSARITASIERYRKLAKELHRPGAAQGTDERLRSLRHRIEVQGRAQLLFYLASILLVACSLMLGLATVIDPMPKWVPVLLGILGVFALLGACTLLFNDARKLRSAIAEEFGPPAP